MKQMQGGYTLLTERERLALKKEIAERLRDTVYGSADKHAEDISWRVRKGLFDFTRTDDVVDITFTVRMCVGDIVQIVSRRRRKSAA